MQAGVPGVSPVDEVQQGLQLCQREVWQQQYGALLRPGALQQGSGYNKVWLEQDFEYRVLVQQGSEYNNVLSTARF